MKNKYTDSTLNKLWRKAVLLQWNNQCARCGNTDVSILQCHHIIRRRHKVMRHSYRNGITGCPECHRFYHTKQGEVLISRIIDHYDWLCSMENVLYKQYKIDNCLTDNEFSLYRYEELCEVIKRHEENKIL